VKKKNKRACVRNGGWGKKKKKVKLEREAKGLVTEGKAKKRTQKRLQGAKREKMTIIGKRRDRKLGQRGQCQDTGGPK